MEKKPTLFLSAIKQYGYSNVYYHHCKYLKQYFDITYFCVDNNLPKKDEDGINTIYIKKQSIKGLTAFVYIYKLIHFLWKKKYSIHVLCDMNLIFLIPLIFPDRKSVLDIRVGHKGKKKLINFFYRSRIKINSLFFRDTTILSHELAQQLGLKNYKLLPLGSEVISKTVKKFDNMYLLYIGTFNNRNIGDTINGFSKFYQKYQEKVDLKYIIAGFGKSSEIEKIKSIIKYEKLDKIVQYIGPVELSKRKKLFDQCNIGVSYIPKTDLYDVQPATKTYEYILSGLPVIATSTTKNQEIISEINGILINDTVDDFNSGMIQMYQNLKGYNSKEIQKTGINHEWKNIVRNIYLPYLTAKISV